MAKGNGICEQRKKYRGGYEPFENMFKRFLKKVDRAEIKEKTIEKSSYEKPSAMKRRKRKENIYWRKRGFLI